MTTAAEDASERMLLQHMPGKHFFLVILRPHSTAVKAGPVPAVSPRVLQAAPEETAREGQARYGERCREVTNTRCVITATL